MGQSPSSPDRLTQALRSQRGRLVAATLSEIENHIPDALWPHIRGNILDAIDSYHGVVLELLRQHDNPTLTVNEHAYPVITEIHGG